MAPCTSCSSEVEEWCKFQPCGDVFCLHCTIQKQCSRGNKSLKCPECDEFVTSIEKRKTIIVSKEARSGTKKRIETVDESFQWHDTDLADNKETGWKPPSFSFNGTSHMVNFNFGDKDEPNDWDSPPVALPPPPPHQYQCRYGIEYNHERIHDAMMAAKEGDRVYIFPGAYAFRASDTLYIDNAIEIIGMGGRPQDTVIYRSNEILVRAKGVVRTTNLTLRHGRRYDQWFMDEPCNEPMIRISSRLDGKKEADFVMENCVIDMGNEEDHKKQMTEFSKKNCDGAPVVEQHAGAISGIAVESAKSVWINKCLFRGGSGAAIAKECVAKECDSGSKESENEETQVEILSTRFADCEEPSFFERLGSG